MSISTTGIQLGVALGILSVGIFILAKELLSPKATSDVLLIVGALALALT